MRHVSLLDTSALLHDPAALFRCGEQDVYLPLAVLHGLDAARQGNSEDARNALKASRFLDETLSGVTPQSLERGIPLGAGLGKLYFLTDGGPENPAPVLTAASNLAHTHPDVHVTVVARDINLRIQATVLGLNATDHDSEAPLDDADLQGGESTPIDRPMIDYTADAESVWGIHARNAEQNLALNLLMDPDIELVTLLGPAGTGKTLLTLAAGLTQTLETQTYQEILMTRATIAIGEEIGYLPGTEEEKMTPWMGAIMDNLEILSAPTMASASGSGARWGQAATHDLLQSRIRIRSLNFMRGRTLLDRFMVLDEAQNLTAAQMRTLITRAGPGTKIICLGNLAQIDTPRLTPATSGLTHLIRRFRGWPKSAHLTLTRGERSALAAYASDVL